MSFESILNQIFQPYFYYSIIFLVISFVCIKVLTRYGNFLGQRIKSLLFLVPLAIPLIVMLIFMPSTAIQSSGSLMKTAPESIMATSAFHTGRAINGFSSNWPMPPLPPQSLVTATVPSVTILSVTGILCIIGLFAGGFFALSMLVADDRVARKVLHVISLSPSEHQWLQTKVAELSHKLAIATPKIGLIEDLRPNAFTIGYGDNTTIVFSIGLLNILDHDEIAAVAAHELGHVKHYDFFYKTLSSTLTAVSFFNPFAYIASSTGQREREMYADKHAIELSEKPAAFGNALAKICRAIENLPKESMLISLSSNLLVTSSVLHRIGILSTHPRLDTRLRNISGPKSRGRLNNRNIFFGLILTLMLVFSAIAVSYAMVNIQTRYTASQQVKVLPLNFNATGHGISGIEPSSVFFGTLSGAGPMIVNAPIHQIISGTNNNTIIIVVNNGASLNSQVPRSMNEFFVVRPQNVSFDPELWTNRQVFF